VEIAVDETKGCEDDEPEFFFRFEKFQHREEVTNRSYKREFCRPDERK